jgi:hypothetical protein
MQRSTFEDALHTTLIVVQFRPEPEISFFDIQELSGLRQWLRSQFVAVVYGFDPNDPDFTDAKKKPERAPTALPGFYLAATSILGPIRLRQLRVRANTCKV